MFGQGQSRKTAAGQCNWNHQLVGQIFAGSNEIQRNILIGVVAIVVPAEGQPVLLGEADAEIEPGLEVLRVEAGDFLEVGDRASVVALVHHERGELVLGERVGRVELDRGAELLHRLVHATRVGVGEAQVQVRVGVVGLEVDEPRGRPRRERGLPRAPGAGFDVQRAGPRNRRRRGKDPARQRTASAYRARRRYRSPGSGDGGALVEFDEHIRVSGVDHLHVGKLGFDAGAQFQHDGQGEVVRPCPILYSMYVPISYYGN
mgnify:CR=1 FL=1